MELHDNGDRAWYRTEQELFFFTLCRISNDPLHILHRVEQKGGIKSGFTDEYVGEDLEGQIKLLHSLSDSEVKRFFLVSARIFEYGYQYLCSSGCSEWWSPSRHFNPGL